MDVLERIEKLESSVSVKDRVLVRGFWMDSMVANTEDTKQLLEYAKLGKRMQWVSVADRLPEDSRRMWIYDGAYIYVGIFECGKFYDIELSLKDVGTVVAKYREIKNVTHYMPLPPNPEEGY